MAKYVLAIDQGTTSSRALLVDRSLRVAAQAGVEFPQHFPRPGWVEHDLADVWGSTEKAIGRALRQVKARAGDIAAIGITNQRETTCLWDRRTGKPVHRAIVWQDRRTADACARLKAEGKEDLFRRRTGLVLDPYFSGTKLAWLLDKVKDGRARAEAGQLAFGTVDSFLVWKLTGGASHVTDVSNASRTLLLDLARLTWDPELLGILGVPAAVLPRVVDSSQLVGTTRGVPGLPDGLPVAGIAGDQQAALFGQACFEPGETKCTYGTGAFMLQNVGTTPVPSRHGLLTTVAWRIGGVTHYALEGSAFVAGAAVQWLRDGLKLIRRSADVEALARSVPDSAGVVFVPALAGLGAPHWRPAARGLVTGIDRGTTAGHLARATLEGIAFQVNDLASAMRADSGVDIPAFRVDGGATRNDLLMQFQADLLGVEVERPRMIETTALGAAFLAGLATGFWSSPAAIRGHFRVDKRFKPRMKAAVREEHLARWRKAVEAA
jgi:glycerol kinase